MFKELEYFFQSMLPLKEKILALVIQLPPSLKITEGIENLRQHIVPELDSRFRYAIEVRDRTWFQAQELIINKREIRRFHRV